MSTDTTNEFSFMLKPSKHGIGVFAVHNIPKDTYLRLFGDIKPDYRPLPKEAVPLPFRMYCADRGEMLSCPLDFGVMPVGWYLNHSSVPNAKHSNYEYFAVRDIREGEEITIDYNTLEEPSESREGYYSA